MPQFVLRIKHPCFRIESTLVEALLRLQCPDERHFVDALSYIPGNPVKRGCVRHRNNGHGAVSATSTGEKGGVEIESEWTARKREGARKIISSHRTAPLAQFPMMALCFDLAAARCPDRTSSLFQPVGSSSRHSSSEQVPRSYLPADLRTRHG